jgi:hypothetical protein
MKSSIAICATAGALAVAAIATTMPAQARYFGPGVAGGLIAGALVAGAASSAYAYAPGPGYAYPGYAYPGYAYDGYMAGPGYYVRSRGPYATYGVPDDSQHGGQPSYARPFGE